MNNLIETSIKIVGIGRGPDYATIFNVNTHDVKGRVNYIDLTPISGKKVIVLFSYNNDEEIKDAAVEIIIPVLDNEFSIKNHIISELKNILKNVN